MRLKDRVAIITGSAGGIGRSIAELFAAEGAKVTVFDIRGDKAAQVVENIKSRGGTAISVTGDATSKADLRRMVDETVSTFGALHILCNNVGTQRPGDVIEVSEEDWDLVMNTCLRATFLASKYALPHIIQAGGGAVINIASVAGLAGGYRSAAYNAAKAAIINLTRGMALDFAERGVRANCICPGVVDTPGVRYLAARDNRPVDEIGEVSPMGRRATMMEIAYTALFLASEEASHINGVALPVDGGLMAGAGLARRRSS